MCNVCQGKKNCALCSKLALHIKSEVTALPSQEHTVDSWALEKCVRIKAKLFMMDDITDSDSNGLEVRTEYADGWGDTDGFTHGAI